MQAHVPCDLPALPWRVVCLQVAKRVDIAERNYAAVQTAQKNFKEEIEEEDADRITWK